MRLIRCLLFLLLAVPIWADAQITFVDATTDRNGSDTSQTPAEPTGAAEDDIIIAVASISTEDGTWTDPADFTEIDTQVSGDSAHEIYVGYKVRGADAGSGYQFSYSGTAGNIRVTLYAFRGQDATPFDVTYASGSHYEESVDDQTDGNPAITTATNGAVVVLLQAMRFSSGATAGAPSGYTGEFEGEGSGPQHFAAYRTVSSAGTETPGAWTHTGANAGDDPLKFTLALRPAASAPTFSANPVLDSCDDTGCTFNYTATDSGDTLYAMFLDTAASAPTCDAIEAQTGSHGDANESTTGSADSITITSDDAPEFPRYDAYFCIENAGGEDSAVQSVLANALQAPTGFQFAPVTTVGADSPCALFNAATDPDIAGGDFLLAPDDVSPGSYSLIIASNCHFTFDDGGEGAQQSAPDIAVFDASAGAYHADDIDFWANNNAPTCTASGSPEIFVLDEDEAMTPVDLNGYFDDEDADALTFNAQVGTLAPGTSLGGTGNGTWSGTPTTEDEGGEALTIRATDPAGATADCAFLAYVVGTVQMPNIEDSDIDDAISDVQAAFPWRTEDLGLTIGFRCNNSEAANEIIAGSQSPAASAEVAHDAAITANAANPLLCGILRHRQ